MNEVKFCASKYVLKLLTHRRIYYIVLSRCISGYEIYGVIKLL